MRKITVDEAGQKLADPEGVTVVDSRNADEWARAQTKGAGAIRIPGDSVEKHLSDVSRDDYVIVYCT